MIHISLINIFSLNFDIIIWGSNESLKNVISEEFMEETFPKLPRNMFQFLSHYVNVCIVCVPGLCCEIFFVIVWRLQKMFEYHQTWELMGLLKN